MKHIIFLLFIIATLISSLYGAVVTLAPTNGATAGGTGVTVSGNPSFGTITSFTVTFGGVTASCVKFSTSLDCTAPAGTAGNAVVSITINGVVYGATGSYLYQDILGVSSTPLLGPSIGGTTVTVTNTNTGFINAGANNLVCAFNGANVNAVFVSTSQITCISPAGTSGTSASFQVSNNGLDFFPTTAEQFLYNDVVITSINPNSGSTLGGTTVTATGTGFLMGYTPKCMFGTSTVSATVTSTTTATCVAPAEAAAGVAFQFSENGVDFVIGPTYTYISLSVTSLSTATGPTSGGTVLNLNCVGFKSV
jgi:hypothetical protein